MTIIKELIRTILIFLFAAQLTGSAIAGYECSNLVTIYPDSMEWQYVEVISGQQSCEFKNKTDNLHGNKDGFVSTWELMENEKYHRDTIRNALKVEMDVRIDNSTEGITVEDIDASFSVDALGPVDTQTSFTNTYYVIYGLKDDLLTNGSTIWLQGEPGSFLSVEFPNNTQIISCEGIDNVSIHENLLSGRFNDSTEENVVWVDVMINYYINMTSGIIDQVDDMDNMSNMVNGSNMSLDNTSSTQSPFLGNTWIILILLILVLFMKKVNYS
ncbi:MAG: hypothetical protein K8R25_11350 [Methanosarcinales archaeon]|nr:hypothetical protein [Methanosarcinales archaeon]